MASRKKPNAIQKAVRKQIRESINNHNSAQKEESQPMNINISIPIQINIPKIDLNFFF